MIIALALLALYLNTTYDTIVEGSEFEQSIEIELGQIKHHIKVVGYCIG
ncbi:MAG: hypothetical protein ACXV5F_09435 [Halobacteriota archaeon]